MYVFCEGAMLCSSSCMFVCFVQISEKPLICASARGNIKLVELLLTYGADINERDRVTVLSFLKAYCS